MTDTLAQDQLKAYVRRIEALDDEIKVLNEDKSEVYAESKANGFDNKILRKVVAERRKGSAEREEQDALFQLYWDAVHDIAHAHVEIIEEFDPTTGEFIPAGNGASGAEEEAQVATMRASSSANNSLASGTTGRDLPAVGVSTSSAGTGGEADRQPIHAPHYEAAE